MVPPLACAVDINCLLEGAHKNISDVPCDCRLYHSTDPDDGTFSKDVPFAVDNVFDDILPKRGFENPTEDI